MSAVYNSGAFAVAHKKFLNDPKTLDESDLEQFAIVDPAFADRARAKRAGFVEAADADTPTLARPMTGQAFVDWYRDDLSPILATYRHKAATMQARLDALEARLLELEAQGAVNVDVSDLIQ
jgi:hypothetical protein